MAAITCLHCKTENDPLASNWWYCSKCGNKLLRTDTTAMPVLNYSTVERGANPPATGSSLVRSWIRPAGLPEGYVALRCENKKVVEDLPQVCICCGKPATRTRLQTFRMFSNKLSAFIEMLLSGPTTAPQREIRVVSVPVCDEHHNPWRMRSIVRTMLFVHLFVLSWGVFTLFSFCRGRWELPALGNAILIGWVFVGGVLLLSAFVISRESIRPKGMTGDTLVLAGVSKAFVKAIHDRDYA